MGRGELLCLGNILTSVIEASMEADPSFDRYLSERNSKQGGGRGECSSIGSKGPAVFALAGHHKFSAAGLSSCNPLFDSSASNRWQDSCVELPRCRGRDADDGAVFTPSSLLSGIVWIYLIPVYFLFLGPLPLLRLGM